ncbi:MAG TPA: hypothetical protein PLP39_09450 [Flavobacterium lutivivi]|nr:hypothetical protein [Flavobacterium lutivivi]
MVSINYIRNATLFILNKNNLGYIGVSEFDIFCGLAVRDIYENLFYEYNQFINKQNKRLTSSEYGNIPKNIQEQIDHYASYTDNTNFIYDSNKGTWSYTENDLYRVENLSLVEIATQKKIDVELVSKSQLNVLKNSPMTTPSLLFPAYVKIMNQFEIFPTVPATHTLELFYLRSPLNPKWTYTTVAGNPVFNPSASDLQNIDLHESLMIPFLMKLLMYCGVSLREEQIEGYVNNEEMKKLQVQQ